MVLIANFPRSELSSKEVFLLIIIIENYSLMFFSVIKLNYKNNLIDI